MLRAMMSMRHTLVLGTLCVVCATSFSGCHSTSSSGTGLFVASVPGQACFVVEGAETCGFTNNVSSRLQCKAGVWVQIEACVASPCTSAGPQLTTCSASGAVDAGADGQAGGDGGAASDGDGAGVDGDDTDSAATTDTASATDSVASDAAGDAADDAAGDATTTTAKYGAGCTAAADVAFRTLISTDAAKGTEFLSVVKDCTLTKGCLSKADEAAKTGCIRDCIADATISKDNKLSLDCAACYGTYKGFCGAAKCITFCAVDAASAGCTKCLADNCDPNYELCLLGDK